VGKVLAIARAYRDLGMHRSPCGHYRMADPVQVAELTQRMLREFPAGRLALHFHNTVGWAGQCSRRHVAVGAERFEGALGDLEGVRSLRGNRKRVYGRCCAHALCMRYSRLGSILTH